MTDQVLSSPAASPSVLSNATHTRIHNSSFNITHNVLTFRAGKPFVGFLLVLLGLIYSLVGPWRIGDLSTEASLEPLYNTVAPNAILNGGGRADEVRCHPGTREEVIGLIERVMEAQNESVPRMLWLSGPAGAGKTAIMQTVAERCDKHGIPHANFFFFRADRSRNDAKALVATLIHQIVLLYPPRVGHAVATALASNPLLFRMGLREQFDTLMHLPLTSGQYYGQTQRPLVLLLDGLDECDSKRSQVQILQALDALLALKDVAIRVIVASRVEPQIAIAFKQLRSQFEPIFLDEKYLPEKDIHLFVTAEFDKIKLAHADTLDADWPSDADVVGIVRKSSGQFIFAATVMRFISESPSPRLSLQKVQGIVPPAKNSPFAYIDAVYTYILQQVDDADAVMSILASTLISRDPQVTTIKASLQAYHSRYSDALVDSCIAELSPLAQIHNGRVQFYHASFVDFLQDKSRAGQFYIDVEAFSASIFPTLWKSADWRRKELSAFARSAFRRIQLPNPEITAMFEDTDQYQFPDDELEERNKIGIKYWGRSSLSHNRPDHATAETSAS